MAAADSVAEYSFTGIDTSPKLIEREAMERAAMPVPAVMTEVNRHPAVSGALSDAALN
jgi:hypothetical protein